MKRLVTLLLTFCICISGCGGKGGGGGNLTITAAAEGNQTSLLAGLSIKISAELHHTGGNPAVSWSLSGCASNCGSLNSTMANPVTYTAPQIVSASFTVTVVATAAANSAQTASVTLTIQPQMCSSGNEAALMGQYAFVFQGGSTAFGTYALAGSFTADGTGRIAAGMLDISPTPMPTLTIQANGSSYTLGPDNRGCLTLATSELVIRRFRFAVGAIAVGIATKGRIIEFDDASGSGTRGEGILRRQDPTSFTTNSIQGNYVFGSVGSDPSAGRVADLGVFNAMNGLAHPGQLDVNRGGALLAPVDIRGGTIEVRPNGRGSIGFSASASCGVCQGDGFGVVLYMVSSQEMVFLSTPGTFPILTGQMFKQALNNFDNSTLNAISVVEFSGFRGAGSPGPDASVGVARPDGIGAITLVLDTNSAGAFTPLQPLTGTFMVSSNGRVTTAGLGNASSILYLIDSNRGLFLGTGQSAAFGSFDPQIGAPFTDASLSGLFFFGMEGAQAISRVIGVGSINFDGRALYSGTEDDSSSTGLSPSQSFTGIPYSFTAAAQPGRGTLDSNGNTIGYIVSANKLVYINATAAPPRVVVVEK